MISAGRATEEIVKVGAARAVAHSAETTHIEENILDIETGIEE